MQTIASILASRQIQQPSKSTRKINETYEVAKEFADYLGLNVGFVLRCFKIYGRKRVLMEKSFLKDVACPKNGLPGYLIWKLKQV